MNNYNILVVGNKDVGKTTFINTFCAYYNQKKSKVENNIILHEFTKESKMPENIDLIIYIIDIFTKSYDNIEYWMFELNKPNIPKIFITMKMRGICIQKSSSPALRNNCFIINFYRLTFLFYE